MKFQRPVFTQSRAFSAYENYPARYRRYCSPTNDRIPASIRRRRPHNSCIPRILPSPSICMLIPRQKKGISDSANAVKATRHTPRNDRSHACSFPLSDFFASANSIIPHYGCWISSSPYVPQNFLVTLPRDSLVAVVRDTELPWKSWTKGWSDLVALTSQAYYIADHKEDKERGTDILRWIRVYVDALVWKRLTRALPLGGQTVSGSNESYFTDELKVLCKVPSNIGRRDSKFLKLKRLHQA